MLDAHETVGRCAAELQHQLHPLSRLGAPQRIVLRAISQALRKVAHLAFAQNDASPDVHVAPDRQPDLVEVMAGAAGPEGAPLAAPEGPGSGRPPRAGA